MDKQQPAESELVRQIHAAAAQFVLAVTGGGSRAIASLLTEPGASRTLLSAAIPYCAAALDEWLGGTPQHYCSARTARAMAMQAFQKSQMHAGDTHGEDAPPLFGIACTAGLASDRPKRGPHRYHIALQSEQATVTWSVELRKGARSRSDEEDVVATHILNVMAEACGIAERLDARLADAEQVDSTRTVAPTEWRGLLSDDLEKVPADLAAPHPTDSRAIFPGAFDPLHAGHREMAEQAERMLGLPVAYEISIRNVDKPPLDYTEMRRLAGQFDTDHSLWFTRAMTFLEKSRIFPGATFIVGADTIARVADPRYYAGDEAACHRAQAEIVSRGCRFLVFGRMIGDRYCPAEEVSLPEPLCSICTSVPEATFRRDISSTQIRQADTSD